MHRFTRNENIKLYRRALSESTDKEQRYILSRMLRLLLLEEVAQSDVRTPENPGQ
jgi:hypothetical protein